MLIKKPSFVIGSVFGIIIAGSLSATANIQKFNLLAEQKGLMHNINPNLIRAIVSVESAGRIDAVSNKGASGLMQLMPATAESMGVKRSELFIPERNMEAGTRYLAYLNRLFKGDPRLVSAAYNAGEGAVQKYGGIPPYRETQNYVPSVLSRMKLLELCGDACYTRKHMINPQKYISLYEKNNYSMPVLSVSNSNAPNSGSIASTFAAISAPLVTNNIDSWITGKPVAAVQPVQAKPVLAMNDETIQRTVKVVDTPPPAAEKPTQSQSSGFVMVLQSDGSYKNF